MPSPEKAPPPTSLQARQSSGGTGAEALGDWSLLEETCETWEEVEVDMMLL